jgi:hypothetical protein
MHKHQAGRMPLDKLCGIFGSKWFYIQFFIYVFLDVSLSRRMKLFPGLKALVDRFIPILPKNENLKVMA